MITCQFEAGGLTKMMCHLKSNCLVRKDFRYILILTVKKRVGYVFKDGVNIMTTHVIRMFLGVLSKIKESIDFQVLFKNCLLISIVQV